MTTVTSFAEQRLQTINQRIMSTTRLLEIINQFDLYKEFREKRTTEEVVEKMREDVKLKQISAEVMDRRTGRPTAATIAFSLSYEGKDQPQKILKVATVLASFFLEENLKVRERQTQEAFIFFEEEAARVKEELDQLEAELSQFKEGHMSELPELLQLNISTLQSFDRDMDRFMEQLRSLKEREGYLESQLSTIPPKLENADRNRLDELRVNLVYLKSRFSEEYPDVIKTKLEIAALEKKIGQNKEKTGVDGDRPDNPAYITLSSQLASTQSEIESVKLQMKELKIKIAEYRRRIEATPKVEETYGALVTARNNKQAKHDDLLRKSMEAKVAQGLEKEQKGERFTLIDPARLPEKPHKPNRFAILAIGLVLGAMAGAGFAFLREMSDQSVRKGDVLALSTSLPVLADLPNIVTAQDRHAKKIRRTLWAGGACAGVIIGVVLFHLLIMDLDIFWIKVMRRLELFTL